MEKEYISCNLCDSKDFKILYKDELGDNYPTLDYNFSQETMKTYQIVKCKQCGLIYVNPRPKNIYKEYEETEDIVYLNSQKQRIKTAEEDLKKILKLKKRGDLLDIGCNIGLFMDVAKNFFNVEGVELSKWSYNIAKKKKHKLYNKPLNQIKFNKKYDVITLYGVIEHFENPYNELKKINDIMKDNGLLVVYTGNVDGILPKILKKKWLWYQGMHFFFFSKKTLKKLIEKCGFEIIKIQHHTTYMHLFSLGIGFKRWRSTKRLYHILNLPIIKNIIIPLTLSGEMLVFAKKI